MIIARIAEYVYTLGQLSILLGKPFDKAMKEDIIQVVEKIERSGEYSDWSPL